MNWKKSLREEYKKELPEEKPNRLLEKAGIEHREDPKVYHNPRPVLKAAVAIALAVVVLAPAGVFLAAGLSTKTSFQAKRLRFDAATQASIQQQKAKALNHITYTDHDYQTVAVAPEFVASVNAFSNTFHQAFATPESYLYSPLGVYLNLDLLSLGASGPVKTDFNVWLGSSSLRDQNVVKTIEGNFFTGDSGSAHIYQGAFLEEKVPLVDGYVDRLTARRAEAYSLDLKNNLDVISDWSNQLIGMPLSAQQLGYEDLTVGYWLSLLEFKGRWNVSFNEASTKKKTFHGQTDEEIDFMTHTIYIGRHNQVAPSEHSGIYDYGNYVSAYDYYRYGYSIQYLVPKKVEDDIFVLTQGKNIFEEDMTKRMSDDGTDENAITYIQYHVPKFSQNTYYDLTPAIKKTGLTSPYSDYGNALAGAMDLGVNGGIVSYTKQANKISFDEDGTIAKSLTWSMGMAGAAAPAGESSTYVVDLNQPFIYVIRDPQGIPLFCGAFAG